MLLQEAISNLKIHQQWRLGADIVMIEPKELTESIDIVLSQLHQQEISDKEIEKSAKEWYEKEGRVHYNAEIRAWVSACKWYREQLKIIDKIIVK
jgi:hypothetical protein